jgi:hypothetical protein
MKTAKSQTRLKENLLHPTKGELKRLNKFDYKEVRKGISHEKEHTKGLSKEASDIEAAKIAGDHLEDDPEYYEKLEKAKIEDVMSFDFFAVSEGWDDWDDDTPKHEYPTKAGGKTSAPAPKKVTEPEPEEPLPGDRPAKRGPYRKEEGPMFAADGTPRKSKAPDSAAKDIRAQEVKKAKRAAAKAAKVDAKQTAKETVVPGQSYINRRLGISVRPRDVKRHNERLSAEGFRDQPLDRAGVAHHIELHTKLKSINATRKGTAAAVAAKAKYKGSNFKGKSVTTTKEGPWIDRKPSDDAVTLSPSRTMLGPDSKGSAQDIVGDAIIGDTPTSDKTKKAVKFTLGGLRAREKRVKAYRAGVYTYKHGKRDTPSAQQQTESNMKKSYFNQLSEAYNLSYSQLQGGIKNNVTKRERTAGHLQAMKNPKAAQGAVPPKPAPEAPKAEAPKMASVFSRSVGGGQDFTHSPLELKAKGESPRSTGFSAGERISNIWNAAKQAGKSSRDAKADRIKSNRAIKHTAFVRGGGTPKENGGVASEPSPLSKVKARMAKNAENRVAIDSLKNRLANASAAKKEAPKTRLSIDSFKSRIGRGNPTNPPDAFTPSTLQLSAGLSKKPSPEAPKAEAPKEATAKKARKVKEKKVEGTEAPKGKKAGKK